MFPTGAPRKRDRCAFLLGAGRKPAPAFLHFAQSEKNVKKGVDKSIKAEYSSDCSAVEASAEAEASEYLVN